jgi:cytochrome c-type biogenesis protein CcmH
MRASDPRRTPIIVACTALWLSLSAAAALAVQPDEILPDASLETRARGISAGLRCLVCQNQSIDDSNAPLARDLRLLVRERLTAGDSDRQVVDYVVMRYGDFVLLKPPFNVSTLLLWLAPLLILLAASAAVYARFRTPSVAAPPPLSTEEQARLDAILKNDPA